MAKEQKNYEDNDILMVLVKRKRKDGGTYYIVCSGGNVVQHKGKRVYANVNSKNGNIIVSPANGNGNKTTEMSEIFN